MTGCVALLRLHVVNVVIPIQTTGFYNVDMSIRKLF